ncbi:unnamed protein product [Rotaria magnacalcarata]
MVQYFVLVYTKQITTATSNLCQTVESITSGHGNGKDKKRKHQVVEKQDKIVLKQEPKQQSQQLQASTNSRQCPYKQGRNIEP